MDVLADSEKFPEHWLFKHRWGRGKKNQPSVLPNGEKIVFLTVGGRTSAVVPSVQKKTGAVSKDVSDEDGNVSQSQPKRKRATPQKEEGNDSEPDEGKTKGRKGSKKQSKESVKNENKEDIKQESETTSAGRRRSTRNKK